MSIIVSVRHNSHPQVYDSVVHCNTGGVPSQKGKLLCQRPWPASCQKKKTSERVRLWERTEWCQTDICLSAESWNPGLLKELCLGFNFCPLMGTIQERQGNVHVRVGGGDRVKNKEASYWIFPSVHTVQLTQMSAVRTWNTVLWFFRSLCIKLPRALVRLNFGNS